MAALRCIDCGAGTNSTLGNLMNCKCLAGFTKSGFNTCTSCGSSQVPSSDCESTLVKSCAINTSPRKLYGFEDISGKYCMPCSYGTDVGEVCNCPSTSENVFPSFCADKITFSDVAAAISPSAWTVGTQNVLSLYLKCNLARAIHLCSQTPRDKVACSQLANMCTLSLTSATLTLPCKAWQSLIDATTSSYSPDYDGQWKTALPQFRYSGSVVNTIQSPLNFGIVFDFAVKDNASGAELQIYVAIFKPDGSLLQVKPLDRELLLCPSRSNDGVASQSFSVEYSQSCTFDVSFFFKGGQETFLYELYIKANGQYYDIPVAVDYLNPGKTRNDVRDLNGITFTKRFFTVDYLSGVAAKSNNYEFDRCSGNCVGDDCVPQEVRYLKDIVFFTEAVDGTVSVSPKRPYLYLQYATTYKSSSGVYVNQFPTLTYSSVYIYSNNTFWTTWLILLILALLVALLISCARICIWSMNYPTGMPSIIPDRVSKLIKIAIFVIMETFGIVLFIYLMVLTLYIYIFYKWQTQFYFVLPSETNFPESYTAFKWLFWVTLVLVIATNFIAMFKQSFVDIYFIDWVRMCITSRSMLAFSPKGAVAMNMSGASGEHCLSAMSTMNSQNRDGS
jgi:Meckelin (Transmembrane protein 67)